MSVHIPVLLEEVLNLLAPGEKALMVDAHLGEGGHAEAFLGRYPDLTLIGVEVDGQIADVARERLSVFGERFRLYLGWSEDFFEELDLSSKPDRIFFDLGISSFHYRKSGRGFSFGSDEPLDMRLSRETDITAHQLVNTYPEEGLVSILRQYGEERFAKSIARGIVRRREGSSVESALDLAEIVARAVPPVYRYGRIHPATRTFQALRIVVNNELDRLKRSLRGAFTALRGGGRIGVISFHSLEDRIVKEFFRELNKSCTCPDDWPICQCGGKRELRIVTRKPIRATEEEASRNPASRSCRLRVAEKLPEEER